MAKTMVRHLYNGDNPLCGCFKNGKYLNENGSVLCKKCLIVEAGYETDIVNKEIERLQWLITNS